MGFFSSMTGQSDNAALRQAISNGAMLVDVRTPEEFAMGSVTGAVNIPLDILPTQLARFAGQKSIVVFCRSGARSGQAKIFLEQHGYKPVINGGMWQSVQAAM